MGRRLLCAATMNPSESDFSLGFLRCRCIENNESFIYFYYFPEINRIFLSLRYMSIAVWFRFLSCLFLAAEYLCHYQIVKSTNSQLEMKFCRIYRLCISFSCLTAWLVLNYFSCSYSLFTYIYLWLVHAE